MVIEIKEASQETIQKIIKTVPVDIDEFEIYMSANGVVYPRTHDEEDKARYVSECEQNGIIPYSTISFGYYNFENKFEPTIEFRGDNLPPYDKENPSLQALLSGKKFHRIEIEIDLDYRAKVAFVELKEWFLDLLLDEDYIIDDVRIVLGAGYINIGRDVKLEIKEDAKQDHTETLENWFCEIQNESLSKDGLFAETDKKE